MGQVEDMVQVAQDTGACCVFSKMTNSSSPGASLATVLCALYAFVSCYRPVLCRGSTPVRFTDAPTGSYVHTKSLQSCLNFCDSKDCSPPGSSVHGILQTRTLERVAMSSSRGSPPSRGLTCVSYISYIGRLILYH